MSAFTREVLADAAQSGAINKIQSFAGISSLNAIQHESWCALVRSCRQAAKEREAATASAAGDELERQLGVAS